MTLYNNNRKMHYERTGLATGPAIVFVHGLACDGTDWDLQVKAFSDSYDIITVDLNGHGKSAADIDNASVEGFARDVAALVHELQLDKPVLIGHSMGCRVCAKVASGSATPLAGLILVDGSRQATPDNLEEKLTALLAGMEQAGFSQAISAMFNQMFLPDAIPEVKEFIVARAARFPEALGKAVITNLFTFDALHVEKVLSNVATPTLMVQTTNSPPEGGRTPARKGESNPWTDMVMSHVEGAQLSIIDGVGHFPMQEKPEELNRLISNFLREHGRIDVRRKEDRT